MPDRTLTVWPDTSPVQKIIYFTKVGDQICGVCYYEELATAVGCLLLAHSRHAQCADECPLLGAKQTVTNRCLPISIYESAD
jgi:hypothetical protein